MEPLAALINRKLMLPSQKTNYMAVEMRYLAQALSDKVGQIFVDEGWYKDQYPDVVGSLRSGNFRTASEHYNMYGYYEHRMPYEIIIDEEWYKSEYEDIGSAVKLGVFESGQAHFNEVGYREGRIPYPHFQLKLRSE